MWQSVAHSPLVPRPAYVFGFVVSGLRTRGLPASIQSEDRPRTCPGPIVRRPDLGRFLIRGSMNNSWGIVRTRPGMERKAFRNLGLQQYEAYLPLVLEAGRVAILYPSYLFFKISDAWHSVRGTWGVQYVLMCGEAPAAVTDQAVTALRTQQDEDGYIHLDPPPTPVLEFVAGRSRVLVECDGNLLSGIFCGMRGPDRAMVLLDKLGKVMVRRGSLQAA